MISVSQESLYTLVASGPDTPSAIRFTIGVSVGIPAALVCITRRLYLIASTESVMTRQEKRRGQLVDLAIGLGIPVLQMILAIIPQGHRFDILEDVGCVPEFYLTWVYIVLVGCWPIVIGLISAGYAIMAIRTLTKKRAEFQAVLSGSTHASLTASRYNRLIALAAVEVLITVPFASVILFQTIAAGGVSPWISWADTHFDFSRVGQYPAALWKADHAHLVDVELSRWGVVLCPFVFFAFFGASEEARQHYTIALKWVRTKAGYTTAGSTTNGADSSFGTSGTLPVYMRHETSTKRDTLASFSCSTIIESRCPSRQSIEKSISLEPPSPAEPAHHP